MNKEYVVLEGKIFVVELLSYMGSTNYGWCISKLPQQIIVMGTDNVPVGGNYSATVLQRFYFGALSTEEEKADISFTLNNWSDLDDVTDEFTANVKIIKSDSEEFASYSENAVKVAMPYGLVRSDIGVQNSRQDYGLPYDKFSGINPSLVAYGVPCGFNLQNCNTAYEGQGANLKYGYPCDLQQANYKYGYPCDMQVANYKYGYPCDMQDANCKYGYPFGMQDANCKYGYPFGMQDANCKYGYPIGMQDANCKYGYPFGMQDANCKYGYPIDMQDANCKYGYPFDMQQVNYKYGYPIGAQDTTCNCGNANEARMYGISC